MRARRLLVASMIALGSAAGLVIAQEDEFGQYGVFWGHSSDRDQACREALRDRQMGLDGDNFGECSCARYLPDDPNPFRSNPFNWVCYVAWGCMEEGPFGC